MIYDTSVFVIILMSLLVFWALIIVCSYVKVSLPSSFRFYFRTTDSVVPTLNQILSSLTPFKRIRSLDSSVLRPCVIISPLLNPFI